MIFQVERCSETIDDSNAANAQFLSIGVQGDGYVFFSIRMYDNGVDVDYKETTTTLKV